MYDQGIFLNIILVHSIILNLKIVQPYFAKMLTTLVNLWSEKDKDKVDFLICHARHCQQYSAQKLAALT